MPNEHVNHVVINGTTKLDLRADTVTAGALLSGYTAHDRTGAAVSGSLSFVTVRTGSTDPSSSLGSDGDIYLKV